MGFAKGGIAIEDGANIAIAGVRPAGLAAGGNVIWQAGTEPPSWKLLTSAIATPLTDNSAVIDTTGATLLLMIGLNYLHVPIVLSDSENNSWTQGVTYTYPSAGTTVTSRITYCINPATSADHTFSFSGPNYNAMIVWAFKVPFPIKADKSVWAYTTGTSLSLPSLTPAVNNSLIVSAITNGNNVFDISGGFTLATNVPFNSGIHYGGAGAYLIQESTAPVAPVWTLAQTIAAGTAATMMNFVAG